MQVGLSFFIAVLLTSWVAFGFFLEYLNNRRLTGTKKETQLVKRKCEVCAAVYFISVFFEFWRCPFCGSINKE